MPLVSPSRTGSPMRSSSWVAALVGPSHRVAARALTRCQRIAERTFERTSKPGGDGSSPARRAGAELQGDRCVPNIRITPYWSRSGFRKRGHRIGRIGSLCGLFEDLRISIGETQIEFVGPRTESGFI